MSTSNSVGRSASKPKKDRSPNLCTFTFADGRQCRTPRCSGHLHLCYFHAQKEAESLAAQQVGQDISRFLPTKLLTACDLGVAMSRLFCAVAQGQVKPKVASTLAYLAQTMLQSIPIAKHEYINCFDTDTWRSTVRSSFRHEDEPSTSSSQPAATPPGCHSERSEETASSSSSSLATPHSFAPSAAEGPLPQPPQPAPAPHTPLPLTSSEFAQQVMAGLNSSRSEIPPPSAPARDPRSSDSPSSSSTSTTPPQSPANCHSKPSGRREESASSSNSSLATHHSPLPQPVPPPVPPGFGAPANWDVLIPPKQRRRFSRHWHLLE